MIKNKSLDIIEIEWDGPYHIKDLKGYEGQNANGLYQIYGTHEVHGPNTLLYIGETSRQGFDARLKQHEKEWLEVQATAVEIFIGRLISKTSVAPDEIKRLIKDSEQILIHFCNPIYNSRHVGEIGVQDMILLNFGYRNRLPFEVSTLYYGADYWEGGWGYM